MEPERAIPALKIKSSGMAEDNLNPTIHSKELTNVTLVGDDKTKIPAHQAVLSKLNRNEQEEDKTFHVRNVKKAFQMTKKLKFST